MQILNYVIIAVGGAIGIGSTVAIVAVLIGTIALKIYRKVRYGISLYK